LKNEAAKRDEHPTQALACLTAGLRAEADLRKVIAHIWDLKTAARAANLLPVAA